MITRSRAFSTSALKVINNVAKQQYLITLDHKEAAIDYTLDNNTIILKYTNVPSEMQGKGIGKLIAKHAFDDILEKKLNVIVQCHFLAKYYKDNQDKYKNLVIKIDL